jgi:hypothetical protein
VLVDHAALALSMMELVLAFGDIINGGEPVGTLLFVLRLEETLHELLGLAPHAVILPTELSGHDFGTSSENGLDPIMQLRASWGKKVFERCHWEFGSRSRDLTLHSDIGGRLQGLELLQERRHCSVYKHRISKE